MLNDTQLSSRAYDAMEARNDAARREELEDNTCWAGEITALFWAAINEAPVASARANDCFIHLMETLTDFISLPQGDEAAFLKGVRAAMDRAEADKRRAV